MINRHHFVLAKEQTSPTPTYACSECGEIQTELNRTVSCPKHPGLPGDKPPQ